MQSLVAALVLKHGHTGFYSFYVPLHEPDDCLPYFQAPCLGAEWIRILQDSVSLSAPLTSNKTATSCSCRKLWSGTECSWVNSSSYKTQRFDWQQRAGWHVHTRTCTQRDATQLAVGWSGNPEIHSQVCTGQIKVIANNEVMVGLPWDTTLAWGIMGLEEEEVKLWKMVTGVAKQLRVTGRACVCVLWVVYRGGVFWFDESERQFCVLWAGASCEIRPGCYPVQPDVDLPADPRFLCVPEIRAPPSRCLGWGCRGSGLQRASCWAGWVTSGPSHPAPLSAHHLVLLHEKRGNPLQLKT